MDWTEIGKIAAHTTNAKPIAALAVVIMAVLALTAIRSRNNRNRAVSIILAVAVVLLGLAPLAFQAISQLGGVYHVRVTVSGPNNQPEETA